MGNGAARLFAPRKATLFFCRNIYTRGVFRRLRSEGGWGRAESPQCARRRNPLPRRGLTRRLRRGLGLAVPRGAHTFLSVAKEKCAKESQRHGDSGKKPFIAHFGGGARYVARSGVGQLRLLSCALGARLFPPSKWAGLFPSAAYRRSAPPQLAVGRLTLCGLGCLPRFGGFEASRNAGFCSPTADGR